MIDYSKEQIDKLINDIYEGIITIDNLPNDLTIAIFNKLFEAFSEMEAKPSKALLTTLSENLYLFSGAKVYSQINDISLLADNELIKSFKDFKAEALQIYEQYNVNWLKTEYGDTISQGQNVVRWEQIQEQKKILPYLQYSAVLDSQTSEICAPLDGITLPVDDPFWDVNTPQNHYNCRCSLIQLDKEDAEMTSDKEAEEINNQIQEVKNPYFNNNVGKLEQIFTNNHPYFIAQNGE
jgi:SPP1 gp7 family putative phage head morphogenesis protein